MKIILVVVETRSDCIYYDTSPQYNQHQYYCPPFLLHQSLLNFPSMGASKTTANPNKRKKAADMADSPPKRVTRSHTKGMDVTEPDPPVKTTKIKTASVKAAAVKPSLKKAEKAQPTRTTQRKTRANDSAHSGTTDQIMPDIIKPAEPVQAKTRSRRKKVREEMEDIEEEVVALAPKTRVRVERSNTSSATGAVSLTKPKASTTRGTRTLASTTRKAEKDDRTTRATKMATRETTGGTTITRSSTLTIAKAPIARKKVTFEKISEQDKENQPFTGSKKSGIGAKPVRKPALDKSIARRGKSIATKEAETESNVEHVKPLSPKKVLQVAKSVSSEDELAVEKSPVKFIAQSPRKPPNSILREPDDTNLNTTLSVSPKKALATSSLMTSSPRRPPPSPFKGAIKESPKKLDFGSPKKLILGTPAVGTSTLHSQPNFKASLLQSPAKRPTSPSRLFAPTASSTVSTALQGPEHASDPYRRSPLKITRFTPHKISSTPLRATHESGRSIRVQDSDLPETLFNHISPVKEAESVSNNEESTTPPGTPEFAVLGAPSTFSTPTFANSVGQLSAQPSLEEATSLQTQQVDGSSLLTSNKVMEQAVPLETSPINPPQRWTEEDVPPAFRLDYADPRLQPEESDSEDELQSTFKPGSLQSCAHDSTRTPTPSAFPRKPRNTLGRSFHTAIMRADGSVFMTPLASQLSSWLASSPDKKAPRISQNSTRNVSSPVGLKLFGQVPQSSLAPRDVSPFKPNSPLKSTFFEEEIMALDQAEATIEVHEDRLAAEEEVMRIEAPEGSFESHCSTESDQYGDENALPIDPRLLQVEAKANVEVPVVVETCTPVRVFCSNPREIHTVSKVPLRPSADDTPGLFPRLRNRSLSGPPKSRGVFKDSMRLSLSVETNERLKSSERAVLTDLENVLTPEKSESAGVATPLPVTPSGGTWSCLGTPRSVRKGSDAQILRGAVVYVDVHTTEGADASAIFVELLSSMGARCVKQWNWNPRASSNSSLEMAIEGQDSISGITNNKVGITHVVFKDGGKRTLEKVRESHGLVSCVGVGWVLESVLFPVMETMS